MDEKRLRTRLLCLYTVTTALILAAVFAILALLSVQEARQKDRESFLALFTSIAEQLQTGSLLSHSALKAAERESGMLFCVIDAGQISRFNRLDPPERRALFSAVETLAREAGVDAEGVRLSSQRQTSPVFQFRRQGALYYGALTILPSNTSQRVLTAVRAVDSGAGAARWGVYVLGYLVSVALLGLLGTYLIDRALRPAVDSRRRQTEFIASASHELRSPLAVIEAHAATAAQMPEKSAGALAAIAAECERMSRLIGDMLLASADAKSWRVELADVEADTLLLDVYESYVPLFSRQGLRLELSLPETPLPPLRGDAQRLRQVLGILLDNAMSYGATGADKTVTLRAETAAGRMLWEVTDHGCGIPDAEKAHVFDRFARLDPGRGDKRHFGLGLAVARELVERHGGTLAVLDTPGGGSTFRIQL